MFKVRWIERAVEEVRVSEGARKKEVLENGNGNEGAPVGEARWE